MGPVLGSFVFSPYDSLLKISSKLVSSRVVVKQVRKIWISQTKINKTKARQMASNLKCYTLAR